jgi:hypothetical protein
MTECETGTGTCGCAECDECKIGDCQRLADELRDLDLQFAIARANVSHAAALRGVGEKLLRIVKSLNGHTPEITPEITPESDDAREAREHLEALQAEREAAYDRWAASGCRVVGRGR